MAPRVKHHRSSRRVPPPKDSDFDHEISLVDNSAPLQPTPDQEDSLGGRVSRATGEVVTGSSSDSQRKPLDAVDTAARDELNGGEWRARGGTVVEGQEASGPSVHVERMYEKGSMGDSGKVLTDEQSPHHTPMRTNPSQNQSQGPRRPNQKLTFCTRISEEVFSAACPSSPPEHLATSIHRHGQTTHTDLVPPTYTQRRYRILAGNGHGQNGA